MYVPFQIVHCYLFAPADNGSLFWNLKLILLLMYREKKFNISSKLPICMFDMVSQDLKKRIIPLLVVKINDFISKWKLLKSQKSQSNNNTLEYF